jgi:VanZ family protein
MRNEKYINPIIIVLLLISSPFFFLGGPEYHSSRSFHAAWDLGHMLYFFLGSCLLCSYLRRMNPAWPFLWIFFLTFSIVFFVGFSVEVLQMFCDGRTPDVFDVLRDLLGCLTAFAFFLRPVLFGKQWQQHLFRGMVLILLAVAVWPLSRSLLDEYLAAEQFPVLADFETPFERYRWVDMQQLREETEKVRHGKMAMRVQLTTAQYSGISLFHFPGDWQGYQTLRFSVYSPQEASLVLNCRIHDVHHKEHGREFADRFNQQFTLLQGWNDLVISLEKVKNAPRGRIMDMQHIEGFGLFVMQQPHPLAIYLDHVYLSE